MELAGDRVLRGEEDVHHVDQDCRDGRVDEQRQRAGCDPQELWRW